MTARRKKNPREEQLVVVDADNHPQGYATRDEIYAHSLWHRLAVIFPVNQNSQFLMVQRADETQPFPGQWCFLTEHMRVAKGKIERPVRTAQRCYQEELYTTKGLRAFSRIQKGIRCSYEAETEEGPLEVRQFQYHFVLKENRPIEEIKFNTDEIQEVRYMTLQEIMNECLRSQDFVPKGRLREGILDSLDQINGK